MILKDFLKDISCQCKRECDKRCSSVKHRLKCSDYCGDCHEQACNNVEGTIDIDLDDIDENFDIPENSIPIEQSNEGTSSNINADERNSIEMMMIVLLSLSTMAIVRVIT